MTVFTGEQRPPSWCELEGFEVIDLGLHGKLEHTPATAKERLIGTGGTVQLRQGTTSLLFKAAQFIDVDPAHGPWSAVGTTADAGFVRLSGRWGEELGGCGLFSVTRSDEPNIGDPVSYPKHTRIDRHFHDCDEYWIVLSGRGEAVVDDRHSPMKPGDCLAIGTGHHHDFPLVAGEVRAVFFETTLYRQKRTGHLWEHTHGPANPMPERV